jgi:hypothetical protein
MKLGALLKWGILIKGVAFGRVAEEVYHEDIFRADRGSGKFSGKFIESPKGFWREPGSFLVFHLS